MKEINAKYNDLHQHFTQYNDYLKPLLEGKTGVLKRSWSRYNGRKVTVMPTDKYSWFYVDLNRNKGIDVRFNIGIERLDGRPGFIENHSESHASITEIIFDEPLP